MLNFLKHWIEICQNQLLVNRFISSSWEFHKMVTLFLLRYREESPRRWRKREWMTLGRMCEYLSMWNLYTKVYAAEKATRRCWSKELLHGKWFGERGKRATPQHHDGWKGNKSKLWSVSAHTSTRIFHSLKHPAFGNLVQEMMWCPQEGKSLEDPHREKELFCGKNKNRRTREAQEVGVSR